jgi:hypothetical protein
MRIRTSLVVVVLGTMLIAPAARADSNYRQPVWFQWNRATLETIIIPPNHGQLSNGNGALNGTDVNELNPYESSYMRAIEDSIADWHDGVDRFGPTWLKNGFSNPVYVLGRDTIPPAVLQGADIIVLTDESKAFVLGVALRSGSRCIVDNSKLFVTSFSEQDMYNVNAQEYGHCLGLAHVNEVVSPAPANPNDELMRHDAMNGLYADPIGSANGHRHCVSNLNVAGIEEVFRQTIAGTQSDPNGVVAKTAYEQTDCD